MRCYCCNNILTPSESTRKFKESGAFTDMCNSCLSTIMEDDDKFTATVDGEGTDEELFDDDGEPIDDN